jgi:hypothetical protein
VILHTQKCKAILWRRRVGMRYISRITTQTTGILSVVYVENLIPCPSPGREGSASFPFAIGA